MMQWVESTIQDLRFTLRSWGKAPAFTMAAIATLAIGIGANTAIFSVVSGVLLRPLPFSDPRNLVQLYETQPRNSVQMGFDGPVVFQDFEQWRAQSRLLDGVITYSDSARNFQGTGEPAQVATVAAERGLFRFLGVTAPIGRTFDEGDPLNVAVASYGFWTGYLSGDRSAIGRNITLDGQPFTLIGVMPEGFQFPYGSSSQGLWVPWEAPAELRSHPTRRLNAVLARLTQGIGMEAARQELNAMESPSQGHRIVRIKRLKDVVSGSARESLLVLLGAVAMVLLVACVNVANLLLARTASRAREIATRAAVGADRLRLIRQFLTESLVLALGGGIAGLAIGVLGSRLLLRIAAAQIPRAGEIGLDWRVFVFLLAVCMTTGIGFGLAPAIAAARGVTSGLARRGVGSALRDALVVVEVALAFVLLAGAGLLLRTFLNLQYTNPGLNAENVLTLHVVLSRARESMAIEERVTQIPGVRAAGLISMLPLQDSGWNAGFTITGQPGIHETELRYVTPGYFRAMGVALRRGREFSPHDDPAAPRVILINEALARLYFPNEDPVGRATDRGVIIGVVGDVHQAALSVPAKPEIYYAVTQNFGQIHQHGSTLVVRGNGPPEPLVGAIRAVIREVTPSQALFRVATMQGVIEESLANPRLYAWLVGLFAAIGTLLALAGIYGVIAYLVTLRTREFGIRMALGADAGRMVRLVMSRGALLTALGLAMGIGGAAAMTRVLRGVLYGVEATDSVTFGAVAALLAAVALGACLEPARRAARVDPSVALRCE
jgi:putative ABC transport system permease protein